MQETAAKPTLDVLRERLQHLGTLERLESTTEPEFTRWTDTRLDRWIVDWALRNGKEKTARMIASEKGIEVRPQLRSRACGSANQITARAETGGYRSVFGHTPHRRRAEPQELYGGARVVQREQGCAAQAQGAATFAH